MSNLVFPHMRAVFDNKVERSVLKGKARKVVDVRLIKHFDNHSISLKSPGLWKNVGADDFGIWEIFRPGLT